jgi:tetratricopeptide (TPR) repeat protein
MTQEAFERGDWQAVIEAHRLESHDAAEWLRYGCALLHTIEIGPDAGRQQQQAALAFVQAQREGASAGAVAAAQRQVVMTYLRQALQLAGIAGPEAPELLLLAKQRARQGDVCAALAALSEARATAGGPTLQEIHWLAFNLHRNRGDWTAAEESLSEILKIIPTSGLAWRARVAIACLRHDHATVIADANRALKVLPDDPQILAQLCNARLLVEDGQSPARPQESRTLMVTATVPGSSDTGGRYIQSIVDLLPAGQLAFFCIATIQQDGFPNASGFDIAFAPDPTPVSAVATENEEWLAAQVNAWEAVRSDQSRAIAKDIVNFAQTFGATRILILMRPLMFRIVSEIRAISPIRISLIVADPPDYQLRRQKMPEVLHRLFMDDFAIAQRIAEHCAVVSEVMANEYQNAYGHEPIVLRHALDDDLQRTGRRALRCDGGLTIAMLGNIYAADAISAFIAALSEAGWKIAGRDVSLVCMTRALPPAADPSMPIEHLGWLEQDEVLSILERADIGYVPYWFGEEFRSAVRLSFPSKLSTMATAGLPVFFHGPADSSVIPFLNTHPMGLACPSLEATEILTRLTALVSTTEAFAAASEAAETAFREEMSHSAFRTRLLRLVGGQ